MGHSDSTRSFTEVWWWMEDLKIPWQIIFSQLPGLKRLDLKSLPLESRHLPVVLEMTARFCLQLEMLILPGNEDMVEIANGAAIDRVMKTVRGAIQKWYMKGTCGGLKQLTMLTRDEKHLLHSSTAFIEDVIKFCPNVEYLDGHNHDFVDMNDVACRERWMIQLDTWEKFNKTCTNLRSFHWAVLPFANPFFKVFGKHVKPRLKKLTLAPNLSWNWHKCAKSDDISSISFETSGYSVFANDVAALLKGCPALTKLEISLHQEKSDKVIATLLDADVFGDKFWKAVVYHCPLLQSLYIRDRFAYGGSHVVRPIKKFTDCGLLALASHTSLTSIELYTVCCSGNGVFEYMKHMFRKKDIAGGNRSLHLSLAGPNDHDAALSHPFYVELVNLLGSLAATSEEELGVSSCSHKASINVCNPHSASVAKDWSIVYLRDELKPMMEKVAKAHPTLDMHVVICRVTEDAFFRIGALRLNWCHGSQQGDVFIDDEFAGDTDSNDRGSDEGEEFYNAMMDMQDEEFYDEIEDDEVDDILEDLGPHDMFYLRRHAMLLDDEYDVFPNYELDDY